MARMSILVLVVGAVIVGLILSSRSARADMLKEGDAAPAFETEMVVGDQVKPVKLSDYVGRRVVLYFYPKDQTPGCTKEACAFRDGYAELAKAGVEVLGCSVDSAQAHKDFIKKYGLPFPLLLDPDKKIATLYGAANGIPVLGLNRRITYVIDEKGSIIKVYPQVDPALHAAEILQVLNGLPPLATPTASASAAPLAKPK